MAQLTTPSYPTEQLNFQSHCVFCLQQLQPGNNQKTSKNIVDFQPIINYLTGADPTFDKCKEECLLKGLPVLKDSPPMCKQCCEMVGELENFHQLLLHVQCSIQRQTEVIREKITETCPNPFLLSSRKVFNDRILSSSGISKDDGQKLCKFISDLHDAIIFEGKNQVIYPSKPPPSMPSQQLIKAIPVTPTTPLPFTIPAAYASASTSKPDTTTATPAPQQIFVVQQSKRTRNPKKPPPKIIITKGLPPSAPSSSASVAPPSSESEISRKRKATTSSPIKISTAKASKSPLPSSPPPPFPHSDDENHDDDIKYEPETTDTADDDDEDDAGGDLFGNINFNDCLKTAVESTNASPPPTTNVVIIQSSSTYTLTQPQPVIPRGEREPIDQKCDLCGKRCFLPNGIISHLKSHLKDSNYITKCMNPKCNFHFSCPLKAEKHIRKNEYNKSKSTCAKSMEKVPVSHWIKKCELCDFETGHQVTFRSHLNAHEEEIKTKKEFPCPISGCTKMFSLKQSVEFHLFYHDIRPSTTKQKCSICKKSIKIEKMGTHLDLHHEIRVPVPCKHCDFLFPDWVTMLEHILEQKFEEGWTCDLCEDGTTTDGMKYKYREELRKHYFHVHQIGEEKSYICEFCSLEFGNSSVLKTHQHRVHPDKMELGGGKGDKKKEKEVHQTKTKEPPAYPCDLCASSSSSEPVTFKTKDGLQNHKIRVHGTDHYACKQCGETFRKADLFRNHRKEHAGISTTFKCEREDCGRIFRDRSAWHFHQKFGHKEIIGEEDRPFKCGTCGKGFLRNTLMRSHERTHMSVRPHVCDTCGETFKNPQVLQHHKLIHTGERPYACELCGQAFRQKVVLRRHLDGHKRKGDDFKPNGPMKHIRKRVAPKNNIE